MVRPSTTEANFYLLGYYVACFHRYEEYCDQYRDSEDSIEKKAALSYLNATSQKFKKLAQGVSSDLDIDFHDISPDDRDAFLETVNEMEGRSPVKEFIRHSGPENAYRAYVLGDYIGGEIGFCHEYCKMLLPKINEKETRKNIVMILEMKLRQFNEYMRSVPTELDNIISARILTSLVDQLRSSHGKNPESLREHFEGFFKTYYAVTDYYLLIRHGTDGDEDEEPHLYFISYSRKNRTKANYVELMLLRENKRTWRDETDIRAGAKLMSSLYHGVEEAGTFICILSEHYLASKYCMEELEKAVHRNISTGKPRIVVLRLDRCGVPSVLSSRVWLDADTHEKLMIAISRAIEEEDRGR